jgi:hypothetical protein
MYILISDIIFFIVSQTNQISTLYFYKSKKKYSYHINLWDFVIIYMSRACHCQFLIVPFRFFFIYMLLSLG